MAWLKPIKNKRGKGYRLFYDDPKTGRKRSKTLYCDSKTAELIRTELEARLARKAFGIDIEDVQHIEWNKAVLRYLKRSERTKAPGTVRREKYAFRPFSQYIGNPDLVDISIEDIEGYVHHRLDRKKRKPATVSIEIRILKTAFNQFIKWGFLKVNPAKDILLPNQNQIKVRFLRKEEVGALLRVIPIGGFKDLIIAYLHTGARRSELLHPNFTWENVDFDSNQIYLFGKANRGRYVPMNETLKAILFRRKDSGNEVPFDFKPDFVSHKVPKFAKLAGLKDVNVHALRKTFGSLLIQSGQADLYTVSKLLGHSSIKTTERYYVDLLDENYHKSVRILDTILTNTKSNLVLVRKNASN